MGGGREGLMKLEVALAVYHWYVSHTTGISSAANINRRHSLSATPAWSSVQCMCSHSHPTLTAMANNIFKAQRPTYIHIFILT